MAMKDEILRVMPIGVEMTTVEIAMAVRPATKDYDRRSVIQNVYGVLKHLEKWSSVRQTGFRPETRSKVAVWIRT